MPSFDLDGFPHLVGKYSLPEQYKAAIMWKGITGKAWSGICRHCRQQQEDNTSKRREVTLPLPSYYIMSELMNTNDGSEIKLYYYTVV